MTGPLLTARTVAGHARRDPEHRSALDASRGVACGAVAVRADPLPPRRARGVVGGKGDERNFLGKWATFRIGREISRKYRAKVLQYWYGRLIAHPP